MFLFCWSFGKNMWNQIAGTSKTSNIITPKVTRNYQINYQYHFLDLHWLHCWASSSLFLGICVHHHDIPTSDPAYTHSPNGNKRWNFVMPTGRYSGRYSRYDNMSRDIAVIQFWKGLRMTTRDPSWTTYLVVQIRVCNVYCSQSQILR